MNDRLARYSAISQAFHWITAILVLVAFIYGPGGSEERVYSAAHDADRRLHETLGICVLALTLLRIVRLRFEQRPLVPEMPAPLRILSKTVQGLLHLLLLVVPLTAISGAWLEGHPLTLLGGAEIAPLAARSHDAGKTVAEIHTWLGDTILWVAGFHAAAGLYHHFILRDAILVSMLPARFQSPGPRSTP